MSRIDIVQLIFGTTLRDDTSVDVAKGSNRRFTVSADISAPSLDARTRKELSGPQILDGDRRNWPRGLAKASVSPLNIPAGPGKKMGHRKNRGPWSVEIKTSRGEQLMRRYWEEKTAMCINYKQNARFLGA